MSLGQNDVSFLNEACNAARRGVMFARRRDEVRIVVNRKGIIIVELDGRARRDFGDWQAACEERAVERTMTCATPVFAPMEIIFTPTDR